MRLRLPAMPRHTLRHFADSATLLLYAYADHELLRYCHAMTPLIARWRHDTARHR